MVRCSHIVDSWSWYKMYSILHWYLYLFLLSVYILTILVNAIHFILTQ